MCDKTAINEVFSGVILSPSYPGSYRSSSPKPCYLTVHVPANHYIELIIDNFTLTKTPKCVGDYLNIQEYIEVDLKDRKENQARRQWKTVAIWCGKKQTGLSIIIKSDTVSFTFRSVQLSKQQAIPNGEQDLKFKIFFQGIFNLNFVFLHLKLFFKFNLLAIPMTKKLDDDSSIVNYNNGKSINTTVISKTQTLTVSMAKVETIVAPNSV